MAQLVEKISVSKTQDPGLESSVFRKTSMALLAIVILGILAKPFFWRTEIIGNFGSYQMVSAMIGERYIANGFSNFFRPELFFLEHGMPSLELIYFPLAGLFAAIFKTLFGGNLDVWGRMASVLASALNTILVYRLVRTQGSRTAGLLGTFFFTFSPYVWVYGRNFQNEAHALLFLTAAIVFRTSPDSRSWPCQVFSALCLGVAVTLRFHFFMLTPVVALWHGARDKREVVLWGLMAMFLPAAWHFHAWILQNQLNTIHATLFIQLGVGKIFPHPLLLEPSFYAMMVRDLFFWSAGPLGLILAILGLRATHTPRFRWCMLALFTVLIAIATPKKFNDHHFYLVPLVLPISVLAAFGAEKLFGQLRRPFIFLLLGISLLGSLRVAWNPAFKFSAQDYAVLPAAAFVKQVTSPQDKIITGQANGGVLLLYYAGRLGWIFDVNPHIREVTDVYRLLKDMNHRTREEWEERNRAYTNSIDNVEYLREQGASYFFTSTREDLESNPALLSYLSSHYTRISGPDDPFYGFRLEK